MRLNSKEFVQIQSADELHHYKSTGGLEIVGFGGLVSGVIGIAVYLGQ